LAADSFDEDEVLEFVNDRLAWSKLSTATTGALRQPFDCAEWPVLTG
jgi:hypothetical protein